MTLDPEHLVGRTVGNYTIDALIGQGAFAWVFKGHETAGDTPVALKVLRPRYAGDPEFEKRFRNEFTIASEINHPNIVRILEVGQEDETTYFAMDYHRETLAERLEKSGPLTELEVVELARCVASALAFAHEAGVVHRDIKVDNVLLAADGRAIIADFGIAKTVSGYASATGQNMTIGTPQYVSPEQAQGRKLDGRSDLYALGVTLYKALTDSVPFTSTDWFELARMHVEDPPEPPSVKRPDISGRMERIILRLLAKHPDDRYESAAALLKELDEISSKARVTATFGLKPEFDSDSTNVAQKRSARSKRAWMWAVAVIIVVGVALLVVLVGQA